MGIKKQIPTKHRTKKVTPEQDELIKKLQEEKKLGTYLEAKHVYFELEETVSKALELKVAKVGEEKEKTPKKAASDGQKAPRKTLTIAEAKIGVTVVLNHEDCKALGFKPEMTTKEVVKWARKQLGLEVKG